MFDLTGKSAIITGSSKGIGKSIAMQMALQGAKVVVSSRKVDVCEETAKEINAACEGKDGEAIVIPCNISDKAAMQMLVDETKNQFGKVDILVCNAATNPFFGSLLDIPEEAFDKVMNNNIKSNHLLCNMVLPEMIERKDGSIIIVSSVGGLKGSAVPVSYTHLRAHET